MQQKEIEKLKELYKKLQPETSQREVTDQMILDLLDELKKREQQRN